jgi:hypothetical protein
MGPESESDRAGHLLPPVPVGERAAVLAGGRLGGPRRLDLAEDTAPVALPLGRRSRVGSGSQ